MSTDENQERFSHGIAREPSRTACRKARKPTIWSSLLAHGAEAAFSYIPCPRAVFATRTRNFPSPPTGNLDIRPAAARSIKVRFTILTAYAKKACVQRRAAHRAISLRGPNRRPRALTTAASPRPAALIIFSRSRRRASRVRRPGGGATRRVPQGLRRSGGSETPRTGAAERTAHWLHRHAAQRHAQRHAQRALRPNLFAWDPRRPSLSERETFATLST